MRFNTSTLELTDNDRKEIVCFIMHNFRKSTFSLLSIFSRRYADVSRKYPAEMFRSGIANFSRNLLNGHVSFDQQFLCLFQSDLPQHPADGSAGFLFIQRRQIIAADVHGARNVRERERSVEMLVQIMIDAHRDFSGNEIFPMIGGVFKGAQHQMNQRLHQRGANRLLIFLTGFPFVLQRAQQRRNERRRGRGNAGDVPLMIHRRVFMQVRADGFILIGAPQNPVFLQRLGIDIRVHFARRQKEKIAGAQAEYLRSHPE